MFILYLFSPVWRVCQESGHSYVNAVVEDAPEGYSKGSDSVYRVYYQAGKY